MSRPSDSSHVLNVEQVLRLHNLTKDVSQFCERQLRVYLDALAPLFRPRRILGDYVEGVGRESATGSIQNLEELKETYRRACGRPVDLSSELSTPIESMSTQLQIFPWEYFWDIASGGKKKRVTVSSPMTWVISYPSPYSFSMFRQVTSGGHERDQNNIRAFVLRACVMSLMFNKLPSLKAVLEGLRYTVEIRKSAELGDVPLVAISAPFPSFRPSDEIVLLASGVSGRNAFEEIIDIDAVRQMIDPLQTQVRGLLDEQLENL
jgi:hypothetical protein